MNEVFGKVIALDEINEAMIKPMATPKNIKPMKLQSLVSVALLATLLNIKW